MGITRATAGLGVLLVVLSLRAQRLTAQGSLLRLLPDSAAVGGEASTALLLTNTTSAPLSSLRLSTVRPPGVAVSLADSNLTSLAAGASWATTLTILAPTGGTATRPGIVLVRLDYQRGGVPSVELIPLRLTLAAVRQPQDVADVQLSSSLANLSDNQQGSIYLLVRNKIDDTVWVEAPRVAHPPFMTVQRDTSGMSGLGASAAVPIPPRQTGSLAMLVSAHDWVRPGKHQVSFTVPLRWRETSADIAGSVVVSRDVDVGVFGESDILKALGIPSFLILPGFLTVVTFGLLRKSFAIRGMPAFGELKPPELMLLGISLSLVLVIIVFPFFGRRYLDGYGLGDVAVVWFWSITLGLVAFVARAGWQRYVNVRSDEKAAAEAAALAQRAREDAKELALRTPATGDKPIAVLRKLARRRERIPGSAVNTKFGTVSVELFEIGDDKNGDVWLAPAAILVWNQDPTNPEEASAHDALPSLVAAGEPAELADFLEKWRHQLDANWKTKGPIKGPTLFTAEQVGEPVESEFLELQ